MLAHLLSDISVTEGLLFLGLLSVGALVFALDSLRADFEHMVPHTVSARWLL